MSGEQTGQRRPSFTDAHVHFFDRQHELLVYDWLADDVKPDPDLGDYSAIRARRYWADDFIAETRFQNVGKVIHVQAATGPSDPLVETQWLQRFADRLGTPHGIVAYCDLAAPDVEGVLRRHSEFKLVRGIRDLRNDDHLRDERWRSGYSLLEQYGFVACTAPPIEAMSAVSDLARDFPGVTLCIDHAGMPRRRDRDYFKRWRAGMSAIAAAPNTVVKISGLGMHDHGWTVGSIRDWVLTCIELWGPERSFFGTNWPIDRLFSSYGDVLDAYWEVIHGSSNHEKDALFHGTANRVFHLEAPG